MSSKQELVAFNATDQSAAMGNDSMCLNAQIINASAQSTVAKYVYIAFLGLDIIMNLTLNIFSLIVLCRVRNIQATAKVFLRSLTISDLGIGLFYAVPQLVKTLVPSYANREISCSLEIVCGTLLFNVNILLLLLLTVDRYVSIVHCLRYPSVMTISKARLLVCVPWALSMAYSTIYILVMPPTYSEPHHVCRFLDESVNFSITVAIILVSVITIVALYAHIALIAHHHKRRIAQENPTANLTVGIRFNTKSLFTFCLITVSLVVCWLPEVVALMIAKTTQQQEILKWTFLVQIANCWFNTVIYYLRNKDFRKAAHSIITSCLSKVSQRAKV